MYAQATGNPPDSVEAIKNFCSDFNSPCCDIDWNKFDCERFEDDKIRIKYKSDAFSATMIVENLSPKAADANSSVKEFLEELCGNSAKR
jgi:hypothetical protein